jgi:hypothetical protein
LKKLDDVYWGGERRGGKRGRWARGRQDATVSGQMRWPPGTRKTSNQDADDAEEDGFVETTWWAVADWAKRHIASGSAVISDGLACFKAVKEAQL